MNVSGGTHLPQTVVYNVDLVYN